jgi:hypothetical protein
MKLATLVAAALALCLSTHAHAGEAGPSSPADGDYSTVKVLPPVVAVYGTGIYPAMPTQVIEWTGPDRPNTNID